MLMRYHYTYRSFLLRSLATLVDALGYLIFPRHSASPIELGRAKKILVTRQDLIGDNFLMSAFIAALKKCAPEAEIDILAGSWAKSIWANNPNIRKLIVFDNSRFTKNKKFSFKEIRDIANQLRSEKYDLLIDPRGEVITAILGVWADIPVRLGSVGHEVLSFLYTSTFPYYKEKNEFLKYEDLLASLACEVKMPLPRLYPSQMEEDSVGKLLQSIEQKDPLIVFHPTTSATYKLWPEERFAKLADKLKESFPNSTVAVLGGRGEERFFDSIQAHTPQKLINLIGELSLLETYALIQHAGLFIGNDSVLAHFAGSVGLPTIQLTNYASGGAERSRAPGLLVKTIEGRDPEHICAPITCKAPCPNMLTISVDQVMETALSMVNGKP